ncbi:MAG: hypothetical protein JWQ05_2637 [Methylobacterium sp.]|nr:hypothetical protein [Methylobacterium sp.]
MILTATRAGRRRTAPLRAVTAVIALYAFVLHAVLGGLVPLPASVSHGILCLGQMDDAGSVPGAPDPSHAHHQPCCTVAGPMLDATSPATAPLAIVWPPRHVSRIAWQANSSVSARGPPGSIPHPRAPPAV